jgi:hypothetical protein
MKKGIDTKQHGDRKNDEGGALPLVEKYHGHAAEERSGPVARMEDSGPPDGRKHLPQRAPGQISFAREVLQAEYVSRFRRPA